MILNTNDIEGAVADSKNKIKLIKNDIPQTHNYLTNQDIIGSTPETHQNSYNNQKNFPKDELIL